MGRDDHRINKTLELLSAHCSRRPTGRQQHLAPLDERVQQLMDSCDKAEDTGLDGDEVDVDNVDWELGETEDDMKTKEPSRNHLKSLETVLKILLESPDEIIADRNWVRQKAFRGTAFTDAECDVVVKLGGILRPYIAKTRGKRNAIAHVTLRAPIAIIANSVLRATG
ncbi:hypothetical protein BGZ65_012889, partial [Modicella reniformis]